jgi:predicted GNAT superfamily acetyltransferase
MTSRPGGPGSVLRRIAEEDRDYVLALNEEHVELLAPMDDARLGQLLGWADLAAVVEVEGNRTGFVITMPSGTTYDSSNYAWFAKRYPAFYYLDRVVLESTSRRGGLGTRVYDEVEARAAELAPVMCLEVNLEPPNEPSLLFHEKRGYTEVGRTESNGHVVSLLVKRLREG